MSSQPFDPAMSFNFPPQTFSSLLNANPPSALSASSTLSHPQAAFHQHFQQLQAIMMAQRQHQQYQQQQQQQQQHISAGLSHQVPPAPFSFMMQPSMPFFGYMGNAAPQPAEASHASASASMRALSAPLQHMGGMQTNSSPFIEGMLKNWSQGLLAAHRSAAAAHSVLDQGRLAAAPAQVARKQKKGAASNFVAEKKQKQVEHGGGARDDAEDSALDVLSAAVDRHDGDRDEASLNAANALHDMLGYEQGDQPGLFALQHMSPRLSKKRNRSLLKELAVSVADAVDDDGTPLTPCSKGRSSKQLDSAYNHTTNPEHVCRTKDGAPVVDIHVPAVCECGSVVVGVWYRNRPHYCRWFRHQRYAPLRALLEQNRRKNKSRPLDEKGAADTPCSAANDASASAHPPTNDSPSESASAVPTLESGGCAGEQGTWGSKTSAEELLAPKFLSLLCLFQFVKHDDAVELVYPRGILGNTMMKPNSLKISAHIDCERSKGFVQYRWYSTELPPLVDDLSASNTENKKVVGCCCLGHWKRKPPGRESSKTTSHLLVSSAIDIDNVTLPFPIVFRKHSI